jgi:hypothetical protein
MVSKVYGTCGNIDIIFQRVSEEQWKTTVPFAEIGQYIVSVTAEDMAGNLAYAASILVVIEPDTSGIRIRILPTEFVVELLPVYV